MHRYVDCTVATLWSFALCVFVPTGVVKGSASLLQNTVHGTLNSASKLSRSLGKGVARLSFDDRWLRDRRREQSKGDRPLLLGSAWGGIVAGARGLFEGPVLQGYVARASLCSPLAPEPGRVLEVWH